MGDSSFLVSRASFSAAFHEVPGCPASSLRVSPPDVVPGCPFPASSGLPAMDTRVAPDFASFQRCQRRSFRLPQFSAVPVAPLNRGFELPRLPDLPASEAEGSGHPKSSFPRLAEWPISRFPRISSSLDVPGDEVPGRAPVRSSSCLAGVEAPGCPESSISPALPVMVPRVAPISHLPVMPSLRL